MGPPPASRNSCLTLPGQTQSFLTLTTCIMTTLGNIINLRDLINEPRCVITRIPHSFEYKHMEAAILTVFCERSAKAQVAQDVITFMMARNGGSGNDIHYSIPIYAHLYEVPTVLRLKPCWRCSISLLELEVPLQWIANLWINSLTSRDRMIVYCWTCDITLMNISYSLRNVDYW